MSKKCVVVTLHHGELSSHSCPERVLGATFVQTYQERSEYSNERRADGQTER